MFARAVSTTSSRCSLRNSDDAAVAVTAVMAAAEVMVVAAAAVAEVVAAVAVAVMVCG